MAAVDTTTGTYLSDLFDPEVIADVVDTKLIDNIVLAPLAEIHDTLQGRAGDTVTLPYYSYIGDAVDVAEGEDIPIAKLQQSTKQVTVSKFGRGVELTDEAVLSSYGNALDEAANQIVTAIASTTDNKLLAALNGNEKNVYTCPGTAFEADDIAKALALFGEDAGNDAKVALVDAKAYAALLASDWIPASEIAANVRVSGVVGMAYGCQILVSNRVNGGPYHIVKPGALAIFMKRDTLVESDRNIGNQSTMIVGSKIMAPYLLNADKHIKIVLPGGSDDGDGGDDDSGGGDNP